jgi:hypothetical protein
MRMNLYTKNYLFGTMLLMSFLLIQNTSLVAQVNALDVDDTKVKEQPYLFEANVTEETKLVFQKVLSIQNKLKGLSEDRKIKLPSKKEALCPNFPSDDFSECNKEKLIDWISNFPHEMNGYMDIVNNILFRLEQRI